ncbi:MAG: TRAP transporter small permease [Magnetospirillum sp.]
MEALHRSLCRIEDALHVLGCTALLLIAILLNADIIMRALFKIPLQMQFELVEFYLMPAVATLSLARVYRQKAHLSLELLEPERFGRWQGCIQCTILACSALFFALLTWKSGQFALNALLKDDIYYGVYDWRLGWAYLSIPVGCGILTLRLLTDWARKCSTNKATA